jgi:hypothetical protein
LDLQENDKLALILSDKTGNEKSRHVFDADGDRLIGDYIATLENMFNFTVKIQKRVEIDAASLRSYLSEANLNQEEACFPVKVRDVG